MKRLDTPPSRRERNRLARYLSRPGHPEGTLSLIELEGFLFAVAAAPDFIAPTDWLTVAFGGDMPEFKSVKEANRLFGILMSLFNAVNADVRSGNGRLPDSVVFRDDVEANLEPGAPLRQWSRGFVEGHRWVEEVRRAYPDGLPEEWNAAVWTLSAFSHRSIAERSVASSKESGVSLTEVLEGAWACFPHSALLYTSVGPMLRKALLEANDPPPRRADSPPAEAGANVTEPLSETDRRALGDYLSGGDRPPRTMTLVEAEGFFFALAAGPRPRRPSDWLPLVFGGEPPDFTSPEEGERIAGALIRLYNEVAEDVRERSGAIPASVTFHADPLMNLDLGAPVAQWSRGFVQGHAWLEEDWEAFDEEALEGVSLSLWALAIWANRPVAESAAAELEWGDGSIETALEAARELFADCASIYAETGLSLQARARESRPPPRPAVRSVRPGRNERCPCDSGRKYKKCCGRIPLV